MSKSIQYKRIYQYTKSDDDGYVFYADKMFPRGLKSTDFRIKRWVKGVAPSMKLIKWFHADSQNRWDDFQKKYYAELKDLYKNNETIKTIIDHLVTKYKQHKKLTILYSSHDEKHNNARVLGKFIKNRSV